MRLIFRRVVVDAAFGQMMIDKSLPPSNNLTDQKAYFRHRTWDALKAAGAGRFPGIRGRIPNFIGAEAAADHLQACDEWRQASVIKCNPDMPQRPLRRAALADGKTVYLAVPRLSEVHPFIVLDPNEIPASAFWAASSIKGAFHWGRPVSLSAMNPIDLVVTGCVGVSDDGTRLGKGGGYSDLEFALLRSHDLISADVAVATTVHPVQRYARDVLPRCAHDVTIDLVATPDGLHRLDRRGPRPPGIIWTALTSEKLQAIPVLAGAKRMLNADANRRR
ncbi:MAG: 5-formyltetrahydrofolate cyclo-ligase [Myxococcota bacterium]|nr:5-formyltetrahydrofolate cyclo-ligase [Myxococcota bacterium]